jgi:hypothetical protein
MDMETENCKYLDNQTVAWEWKHDSRDTTTEQRICKTWGLYPGRLADTESSALVNSRD